ncbi:alpha/beta fold hydrolase [Lentimicrobium sp. S6]|uniref:alpha/beta fold hydrolase n=1 Tax=Lentimicrobium sp. S6 TaxID=2735872 RepID=UPI001551FA5E|nr:alpha/beta fold hydrolase [Lentimicrobium sp. S6]NPD47737.1 alpha/beta fold hydrolase [Lentimicrobium sp. S6]
MISVTSDNGIEFSLELFASDVIALMNRLNIQQTNVVGWSLGSVITQQLIFSHPERIKKAILYATGANGSSVAEDLKGKTLDNPTVKKQIEATTKWQTPMNKLPEITNQVMLLVGTSDIIVGTDDSKEIASQIPGAWLVQFKGAGHLLMAEIPVEFANTVSYFLNTNENYSPLK